MRDLLPPQLLRLLRDRYLAGVADAEAKFSMSQGDEDSVTGALGQSISMAEPLVFNSPRGHFVVEITYIKLRGRGPGAPEKLFGADGVFQIEVRDALGKLTKQKALPFQAKTDWIGSNVALAKQAGLILKQFNSGIVINYSKHGYVACPVDYVEKVAGNRELANDNGALRPLGQILAHDFLDCTVGVEGLFFNTKTERFSRPFDLEISFAITTSVNRID